MYDNKNIKEEYKPILFSLVCVLLHYHIKLFLQVILSILSLLFWPFIIIVYYHLLSPFYLLILIMNSTICYLLVWIASFFFPGIIYFVLQLFRKKDKQDGRPTMPYFNKFSIILLSIFASLNVIMYHLLIQVSNSS